MKQRDMIETTNNIIQILQKKRKTKENNIS